MSKVKDTNYINIQGWMINQLNLKGNDLLVYAIIYGFSQDDDSMFTGGLQYLADWCNSTKRGIEKNINNLIEKGLIQKESYTSENGVKYCNYYITPLGGYGTKFHGVWNKVPWGMEQSSTNKLENKQENNIDIPKGITPLQESPKESSSIEDLQKEENTLVKEKKKKSRYEQFINVIDNYTEDVRLKELLKEHAKLCLEMAKEKPIYANQYKGILRKLHELSNSIETQCSIVSQSIEGGWLSFYELKANNYSKNKPNKGLQMQEPDAKSFRNSAEKEEFERKLVEDAIHEGTRPVF